MTAERATAPGGSLAAPLGGLAGAFAAGRDLELLAPLGFVAPGAAPGAARPVTGRGELARSLAVANAAYGHPRAEELAAKLADPATAVVATGQQTGLFGGPLLALVKAAAAVRWAESIEAAGRPAVAVFWMATEDHDFAEIATATFPASDGLRRLALGEDPAPLAPVGLRTVGPRVVELLAELAALYPAEWFRAWLERLGTWWRPEARFGEAFARQLAATFGGRSPLLLDAQLPELKQAERPHLVRLVERRADLARAVVEREAAILARGHGLQVAPQPNASPLFLLRAGARRRIEWRGETGFALRGLDGELPLAELLETLEGNPAAVSPGVLARPAIQDAVLGTTLLLLGPGEMAYLPQAAPTYALLDVSLPEVALRPRALVLDRRQSEHLAELGLTLSELLTDAAAAERRLGERAGGGFVAAVRERILGEVATLAAPAQTLDPTLEKPLEKTRETIERALEAFASKVAAAAGRRDDLVGRRFAQLRDALLPDGAPQERVLSAAYFPGRYGERFGEALLDQLDLDPRRLSLIDPTR